MRFNVGKHIKGFFFALNKTRHILYQNVKCTNFCQVTYPCTVYRVPIKMALYIIIVLNVTHYHIIIISLIRTPRNLFTFNLNFISNHYSEVYKCLHCNVYINCSCVYIF